nr:MAG: hypothetical protein [Molluscum contagiosum virus]
MHHRVKVHVVHQHEAVLAKDSHQRLLAHNVLHHGLGHGGRVVDQDVLRVQFLEGDVVLGLGQVAVNDEAALARERCQEVAVHGSNEHAAARGRELRQVAHDGSVVPRVEGVVDRKLPVHDVELAEVKDLAHAGHEALGADRFLDVVELVVLGLVARVELVVALAPAFDGARVGVRRDEQRDLAVEVLLEVRAIAKVHGQHLALVGIVEESLRAVQRDQQRLHVVRQHAQRAAHATLGKVGGVGIEPVRVGHRRRLSRVRELVFAEDVTHAQPLVLQVL